MPKTECTSCSGTGLYCGLAEPKGTAVICYSCRGKGYAGHLTEGRPFSERKPKPGVHQVFTDGGLWMIRGSGSPSMSIQMFYDTVS